MNTPESFSLRSSGKQMSPMELRRRESKTPETLALFVKEVQELSVPEETVKNWELLLSAVRTVDDRIDHVQDPEVRRVLVERIKASVEGAAADFPDDPEFEQALCAVQILSSGLGEERKAFFHTLLSLILRVTEEIKVETDPHKAVRLTLLEGQMTSKLLLPFLPEEFKQSDRYQKLVHALSRLGRAGNSFDTFVDLSSDYNAGAVKIKPTFLNRVLFLGAALSSAAATVKDTGVSGELLEKLSHSAIANTRQVTTKGRETN